MAFRRFFSPSRSRSRDGSPARSPTVPITITHLHPPAGDFYLTPRANLTTEGPLGATDENSSLFMGRIEVTLAAGAGPRRIRAIKAGLVTNSTLDLGPGRRDEDDVIFERTVDVAGGMVLDEGTHVFDWRVPVPRTLAAHDFHPEGRVTHTLFAEVEVISPSRSRPVTRPSSPRPSGSSSRSRPPTRPPSPRPTASQASSSGSIPVDSPLPDGMQSPMYEDTVDKVVGKRTCMVIHENPGEGVINLDLRGDGATPGLGVYNLRYTSEIWTICALFNYRLSIPDPSPLASIYAFTISLDQTTEMTSPRDDSQTARPITRTRTIELCGKGHPPPPGKVREHFGTLWTAAKSPSCEIEGTGRLPNDEFGRPSTPAEIITPLRVSHHLIMKVWFSIEGEDGYGNACDPGNTELRMLTLRRPVHIPSCALIPDVVELPSYETIGLYEPPVRTDAPCFLCDKYYSVKDYIANQRHRSGTIPQGECKLCGRKIVLGVKGAVQESGMWRYCACGLSLADMEERMRKVEASTPRGDVDTQAGVVQPPKQEYGRGRPSPQ